jgi:hypothetical protein
MGVRVAELFPHGAFRLTYSCGREEHVTNLWLTAIFLQVLCWKVADIFTIPTAIYTAITMIYCGVEDTASVSNVYSRNTRSDVGLPSDLPVIQNAQTP